MLAIVTSVLPFVIVVRDELTFVEDELIGGSEVLLLLVIWPWIVVTG